MEEMQSVTHEANQVTIQNNQVAQPMEPVVEDLDFSSVARSSAVVVGEVGIKITDKPVEKLVFTKDKRVLVNFASNKVIAIKTHYNQELKSFLCFGGKCCKDLGFPKVKYLFPVNVYDTNDRGKPVSASMDFRCLAVSQKTYNDILAMQDMQGDLRTMDILITCSDQQYQNITLQPARGYARILTDTRFADAKKQAKEFWTKNLQYIVDAVARPMDEATYMKSDSDESDLPSVGSGSDVDFDSAFA